jgi:hypothetical protein
MNKNINQIQNLNEQEIEDIFSSLKFKKTHIPQFNFPVTFPVTFAQESSVKTSILSPYLLYKSYLKIAGPLLALPAFVFLFSFFSVNNVSNLEEKNLAMLEQSNNRLLAEIENLETKDK